MDAGARVLVLRGGQILAAARVLATLDALVETEPLGEIPLKGFSRPVSAVSITRLRR